MRHPKCEHDPAECRIQSRGATSTLLAWSPVYDGNGKRLDKGDPNRHTTSMSCHTCKRRWLETRRYDEMTIVDEQGS